ncbi:MAG: hypothetical protein ACJ8F7_03800, partial [Gemmataceae bacterium]
MAFNPFHAFRKYSKTMFAVLAIVCMLTFVLSSGMGGKGDFLNMDFGGVFGIENKLPEVARLNGKKIDYKQINDVRSRRQIANGYMNALSGRAEQKIVQRVEVRMKDAEPFLRDSVGAITREKAMIDMFQGRITWGGMQQRRPDQALMGHIQTLARASDRLKEQKKTDDAEALDKFRAML